MSGEQSAFPQHPSQMIGSERTWGDPGMSLLDWYAGEALAGLCANPAVIDAKLVDDLAEGVRGGRIVVAASRVIAAEMLAQRPWP